MRQKAQPSLKNIILVWLGVAALLLAAFTICSQQGIDMALWGVYPWRPSGLIGLVFAPFLHGSWSHILNNIPPLVILGSGLFYGYPRSSKITLAGIILGSGLLTWLLARESYHFGASGVNYGLFFFLFTIGLIRRDKKSVALLMIAFFLYGSMILGIFPGEAGISYEMHISGAAMGILFAILLRNQDPPPKLKTYSWQREDDSYLDENPYWLDQEDGHTQGTEEQDGVERREGMVQRDGVRETSENKPRIH